MASGKESDCSAFSDEFFNNQVVRKKLYDWRSQFYNYTDLRIPEPNDDEGWKALLKRPLAKTTIFESLGTQWHPYWSFSDPGSELGKLGAKIFKDSEKE